MKDLLKKLKRRTNLVFGTCIVVMMTATAIFAPFLAPYHPVDDADLLYSEEPPSRTFLFGTDSQGRDILSRVIYGARISLSVGLLSQLMNSIIGIVLGLTAGYFGKWWDDFVMGFQYRNEADLFLQQLQERMFRC